MQSEPRCVGPQPRMDPESEQSHTFKCMGCEVRIVVGVALSSDLVPPAEAVGDAEEWLREFDASLSRFKPESELSCLNADERSEVPASALLCAAVSAGVWAAEQTDGLLDPTLVDQLEAAGYATSRADSEPVSIAEALSAAPPRQPAHPNPHSRWRELRVDMERNVISRPPGLRFDTGGIGKGLAADALARRLEGYDRVAVDCAGDIRLGGPGLREAPFDVEVEHPLTGEVADVIRMAGGGVATSGLGSRLWRLDSGGFGHHLLDPATGLPAWTGLISATALAPSALEAETLSKAALLGGPPRPERYLAATGE